MSDSATSSNSPRLVVIQRNPTSGSGRGVKQLLALIKQLRADGFRVRLYANRDRLDTFLESESTQRRLWCLVAAGGDGTIGSLVNRHSQFPIAVLPMGTENLVARHLRIGRCGKAAAAIVAAGKSRVFDTAFVNDRRFLLMASIGIDADVVRRLDAVRTGNIRHTSYIRPVLNAFFGYDFPLLSVVSADGTTLAEGTHVIATNIPEYGFRMPFAPEACPFDGLLDVRVFRKTGSLATMWHAIRTRLGCADRTDEVFRIQVRDFSVSSTVSDTPVQIDGDPAPSCPVEIRIDPKSMTLIVRD